MIMIIYIIAFEVTRDHMGAVLPSNTHAFPTSCHWAPITGSYGLVSTAVHQETIRVNVIGTLTLADCVLPMVFT